VNKICIAAAEAREAEEADEAGSQSSQEVAIEETAEPEHASAARGDHERDDAWQFEEHDPAPLSQRAMVHVSEGVSSSAMPGRDKASSPFGSQVAIGCQSNINISLDFVSQTFQQGDQGEEIALSQQLTRRPTHFMLLL
jgi:hypothetical protein